MDAVTPRTPIGRRKRAHDVAEALERAIVSGEFAVGDRLPAERALMERFGVGRPAVREALFLLEQRGRLEIASGTRALVSAPRPRLLVGQLAEMTRRASATALGQEQIEQARVVFEAGLAWHAAQLATPADINRLKEALDRNCAAVGMASEFIRTDVAFHYEIGAVLNNPIFLTVHEVLMEWLVEQRTTTIFLPDADKLSVQGHTAVFEAIAARDPARAFHEMATHLRLVSRFYSEAKRLSGEVLRQVAHDVARRIGQEQQAVWDASFAAPAKPKRAEAEREEAGEPKPRRSRRTK